MANFVTAYVLSLVGKGSLVPSTYISLKVVLYSRVREMRRDGAGGIHVCMDSRITMSQKRHIAFPATWFQEAETMRWVLRMVLGQTAVRNLSLDELTSRLRAHVDLTGEHHLVAEIEVVRVTLPEENDAIKRLKKSCGFYYMGCELGTCSVCLEDLSGYLIRTPSCSHHYHVSCIVSWLKEEDSCPLCRSKIL